MKDAGIMEDDLIAVKKTSDVKNGDIVIARLDDEVTIKFFNRKSPKLIELEAANDDFENIFIDLEQDELHIEGKSVGVVSGVIECLVVDISGFKFKGGST